MRTFLRGKFTLLFMMLGMLIAVPAVALADQIVGDGDTGDAVATPQQTVALGTVAPGAQVTKDASFTLLCNSGQHIERGETLSLNFSTANSKVTNTTTNTVAASGGVSVLTTNTDPLKVAFPTVPNDWPLDNDNSCGTPARTHGATDTADITITAPTQPGTYSAVAVFNHVQSASAEQANDIAGNTTTITYNFTVPSDTTAPTVTATAVKGDAPDFTGATTYTADTWTNKDVKVTFTCADNAGGSGLTAASGNQVKTYTTETNGTTATFDGTCKDNAGNTAAASSFGPIKIDKTPPTIDGSASPAPNSAGWNNTPVTVSFVCDDVLSGVPAGNCPADVLLENDGADQSVMRSVTDAAGNSASDTVSNIDIDQADPTASHELSTPANGNGWHKADFTVTLNGSDDSGSGVKELHYTIDNGTEQVASGASKVLSINTEGIKDISYYSVDNAGNESAVGNLTVRLDKTNPTIDGSASPAPNGAGWNNEDVTVSFVCDDALSGVASCPVDVTLSSNGADQSVTRSVSDNAGNSASDTVGNIDIDKTPPNVQVTGVSNGANYTTGAVPTAGCSTTDQAGLSGVKTNASVNVTGGNNGFGTFTATCSGAEDNADNPQAAPVSVQYTVSAAFNGFLQPIDGHAVNTGKYGRTYPIKWQLRDSSGALISDSAAQALVATMSGGQKATTCDNFNLLDTDALEESTTGSTSLRYDATSDQFIYNYKAPSSGSCYIFAIRGADGVPTHTEQIDFKFTK